MLGYIYCVSIVCNVDSDIDGLLVSAGFMCCVFVDYEDVLLVLVWAHLDDSFYILLYYVIVYYGFVFDDFQDV